jgi:hypothetical protein
MIKTAEEFVQLRCSDDPELYKRAAQDSAPENIWHEIIDRFPEMRQWVAVNKTVPLSILAVLINDSGSEVRHAVAMKRKLDLSMFKQLANDSNESVRLAVALNKSTPIDVLKEMVNDDWDRIVEVVYKRINIVS